MKIHQVHYPFTKFTLMNRFIPIVILSALLWLFLSISDTLLNDTEIIYPTQVRFNTLMSLIPQNNLDSINWTDHTDAEAYQALYDFELLSAIDTSKAYALFIEGAGAYQVTWDGNRIGKNGFPSALAGGEVGGVYYRYHILYPGSLHGRSHHALVNYSQHDNKLPVGLTLKLEQLEQWQDRQLAIAALTNITGGVFLITSLYLLISYILSFPDKKYLHLSLICFVLFLLILVDHTKTIFPWTGVGILNIRIFFCALISILSWSFYHFVLNAAKAKLPSLMPMAIACSFLTLMIIFWKTPSLPLSFIMIIALIISAIAYARKTPDVDWIITGIVIFLIGSMYFSLALYLSFSVITISCLISLALTTQRQNTKYEQSMRRSARLELETIKKNIQPHFLMNTLTTIISLIESDPKKGIALIEKLGDEFYYLFEIINRKTIPLKREIELCQNHIAILNIRSGTKCKLVASGSQSYEIPPGIILTLVENSISHNIQSDKAHQMTISLLENSGGLKIEFTYIDILPDHQFKSREGLGNSYIKARLEECYPGNWNFISQPLRGNWVTTISIFN